MSSAASTPEQGGRGADHTAWARNLAAPIRDFLGTESGSAIVLVLAAVIALGWANSPWRSSYESLWSTRLAVELGRHGIALDLRHWVNEGLMTLFFLVVGLEAKRERDMGELRERSRVALPVIAALGGMTLPVVIFLALNLGGPGARGWGAAMSTDTALALGALTLLRRPGATRLRVMLLTIVVVDDLVGLIVITFAYSGHISILPLAVAVVLFGGLLALRFAPEWRLQAAAAIGLGLWVSLLKSGIDPLVAGLAIGLVTSAYPPARGDLERAIELTRSFREQPTPGLARSAQLSLASSISPNERLQHRLHPWTSYVIVPLFALANAGIHVNGTLLSHAVSSPITLGIALGYLLGKPLGILLASWLATRTVLRGSRMTITWPGLAGVGTIAGIGFTVALLIASLAFGGESLAEAKIGILASALLAPVLGWLAFQASALIPDSARARQFLGLAEGLLDLSEEVDSERDHVRGSPHAPVTLVEYGDFECPYCGRAEPIVRELLRSCGDELRYVFRHLPLLDVHPHAQLAAEAAEAASSQGAFWEMHDILLEHQGALTDHDVRAYAQQLGLDVERFWEEIRRRIHVSRIQRDVASADESGVSGTPTFFINGRRHQGAYDVQALTAEVRGASERERLLAIAS